MMKGLQGERLRQSFKYLDGDQDGFTMRTFEACGVGAVQLVDRADVAQHYEPGTEVAVFDGVDEAAELARRAAADRSSRAARRAPPRLLLAHDLPCVPAPSTPVVPVSAGSPR